MRKQLFNPTSLFRKLRQLVLLTAILLVPLGAWGQDSYFGINTTNTANNKAQPYWVTDGNYNDIMGDGKMSYDIDNNVLTLKVVAGTGTWV